MKTKRNRPRQLALQPVPRSRGSRRRYWHGHNFVTRSEHFAPFDIQYVTRSREIDGRRISPRIVGSYHFHRTPVATPFLLDDHHSIIRLFTRAKGARRIINTDFVSFIPEESGRVETNHYYAGG